MQTLTESWVGIGFQGQELVRLIVTFAPKIPARFTALKVLGIGCDIDQRGLVSSVPETLCMRRLLRATQERCAAYQQKRQRTDYADTEKHCGGGGGAGHARDRKTNAGKFGPAGTGVNITAEFNLYLCVQPLFSNWFSSAKNCLRSFKRMAFSASSCFSVSCSRALNEAI